MATTYRVRYKNHATPQEQHSAGDRYYLDSDAGKKFSGTGDIGGATLGGSRSLVENFAVTDSASITLTSSTDFFYIKNTGDSDVLLCVDGTTYIIILSSSEAFASQLSNSAVIKVKCTSGETSTVEYYKAN
tara:strand:+ start:8117 stop:8509 length:393 start_codon:yes stop_codon:yes gene_type:complete